MVIHSYLKKYIAQGILVYKKFTSTSARASNRCKLLSQTQSRQAGLVDVLCVIFLLQPLTELTFTTIQVVHLTNQSILMTCLCCNLVENTLLMRENQLPVSATRWQHGSKICFATFIQ